MNDIVAIGYNLKGKKIIFESKYMKLDCLSCMNYELKELHIFKDVKYLNCSNNFLTNLNLPKSLNQLYCYNNKIKELNIPRYTHTLYCDKGVLGLDKIDWKCNIQLF